MNFNVLMRNYALSKGYSMSEYGLKPVAAGVPAPPVMHTEHDVFTFLGIAYIPPNERTATVQLTTIYNSM
jgi:hypothetical protein